MEDQVAQSKTWNRIRRWFLVLPPSRPSAYHLNIIRKEVANLDRQLPVAVLGCTPEFRDLLSQLGFEDIYLFEKNRASYTQMTRLRSSNNPESVVWGDWLKTLRNHPQRFSLILSDLTSGNIPYEHHEAFYSSIAAALIPEGLFIDKVLTHQGPKRTLADLKLKYQYLPVNLLYVNYFSCEFLFCSELLDIRHVVDSNLFYSILDRELTSNALRKFLSECPKITPHGTLWYYGKDWDELREFYFQHLYLVTDHADEPGSPYYGNLRLMVSRRSR